MLKSNALILSTDSLPNYWLDLIFSIVKDVWLDGIDLAMWKWFDAWDEDYVRKLSFDYDLPVYAIQTSSKLNQREMNKALDLCESTWASTICINAPKITEFKIYDFISGNLETYQKENPSINFSIINPVDSKLFALPIPEYRFSNVIDIVKKYSSYLWLDISNLDTETFEENFIRKLEEYAPYISILYLSDKDKKWHGHLLPWNGDLDLIKFLKKLRKIWFSRPVSIKIDFTPQELSDKEKLMTKLSKVKEFYEKYFLNEKIELEESHDEEADSEIDPNENAEVSWEDTNE